MTKERSVGKVCSTCRWLYTRLLYPLESPLWCVIGLYRGRTCPTSFRSKSCVSRSLTENYVLPSGVLSVLRSVDRTCELFIFVSRRWCPHWFTLSSWKRDISITEFVFTHWPYMMSKHSTIVQNSLTPLKVYLCSCVTRTSYHYWELVVGLRTQFCTLLEVWVGWELGCWLL